MLRKDLLYAMAAGAALSTVACLLLSPRPTTQFVPPQETAFQYEAKPSSPPAAAVVQEKTRNDDALVSPDTKVPVVAVTRPAAFPKAFKKPLLLPETPPVRKQVAAILPIAMPDAPPPVSALPAEQDSATPVARMVTAQEARVALGKVGTDPNAEAIWISAINDPNLPAHQRKDLIEDLNEEGFENPKQPTNADLPRIENRLALIEELAPQALDQTDADAFQEAYKDLKNMQSRLNKP